MAVKPKSRFWRVTRRLFRWFRISILLLVLALLVSAIWLNRVGVPDVLKRRLVAELQNRGVNLQFSRMRLHWYRGLVADNVRVGRPTDTNAPQIFATQAELLINGPALLKRELHLSGVALRGGRMTLPIWGTNDTPRTFVVDKIHGELRFTPPDGWELSGFQAQTFGVKLMLGGSVTNASALQKLKLSRTPGDRSAAAFWYDLLARLEQSQFEAPAEIAGTVDGDANDPSSFRAALTIKSPRVNSPWGQGQHLNASVQITPATHVPFEAHVKIHAQEAFTQWGSASSFNLEAQVAPSFTRWTPTNAHLELTVRQARTSWANAGTLNLVADFVPSQVHTSASAAHYTMRATQVDSRWGKLARVEMASDAMLTSSNLWPVSMSTKLAFGGGEIEWGRAAAGTIEGSLDLPPLAEMEFANTNTTAWARLDRIKSDLRVRMTSVRTKAADANQVAFNADWRAPALSLRNVHINAFDGDLEGSATLDAQSRRLSAKARTTMDPHKVSTLLHTNTRAWLAQLTWAKPPLINASAVVTLPTWTNGTRAFAGAEWDADVLPTLGVSGDFQAGPCAYRGIPVDSARSSFLFSNLTWRLPDFAIQRPEGRATIAHTGHSRTHEYSFDVDSTINPVIITPLFGPKERAVFDEFKFTLPPRARVQVQGYWHAPEQTSLYAEVAVTNASYRGIAVSRARGTITITNQLLAILNPEVVRPEGTGRADRVRIDLKKLRIYLDNATGMLEPAAVTHAVGDAVEKTMLPYKFGHAPEARVRGVIDAHDIRGTDLFFEVGGGPFEWNFLRFQQITGHVHWVGESVTLSNVVGSMHGGLLDAGARFDFPPTRGCDFSFRTQFKNINLHSLVTDLGNKTNNVEGDLNGIVAITNANSDILKSWNGYGNVAVNDGLLWDFRLFGLFSPILNAFKEGAGNSRAKEATSTFIISNSIIHTTDLKIHASGMRLNYEGTFDFDARVNGRMTAQPLRDVPLLGPLVSTVLSPLSKIFEYKVAGTLMKPDAFPVYLPRLRPRDDPDKPVDEKAPPPAELTPPPPPAGPR